MQTPIIDKIRKLLAHANSAQTIGSAEEAATFFARAQALATQHRIELASVEISATEPEDPMVTEKVKENGKRVMGWRKILAWGMCRSMGVYAVYQQGAGSFAFAGRSGDVQTAVYLYRAISAEIERLARELASGQGRGYANAFKVGAAQTVCHRLRKQHDATMSDARASGVSETALVRVEKSTEAAEAWYRQDHRVTTSAPIRSTNGDGLAAGRRAGESINIGGNAAIGRGNLALGTGK